MGSENVGHDLDGKGQECVEVYGLGSDLKRATPGLSSEREG
jgi:hypothetical protein